MWRSGGIGGAKLVGGVDCRLDIFGLYIKYIERIADYWEKVEVYPYGVVVDTEIKPASQNQSSADASASAMCLTVNFQKCTRRKLISLATVTTS